MKLVTLKAALSAKPIAADFAMIEAPTPACPEGGVLVRVAYVSQDPYVGSRLRGRHMGEPAPKPMAEPIPAHIVGEVVDTKADGVAKGDWVASSEGGWSEYCALASGHFRKVDPRVEPKSLHVGVLGMPGLTAWAGVKQLAKVGAGDVFSVDAAAGPVGGTAGQIARILGAERVVGIAGGPEKCAMVERHYGFDACVDYQQTDWVKAYEAALPQPASAHFENVGVAMAMTALARLKLYGRMVLCGLVDQYHADQPPPQLNAGLIVGKRASVMGLVVYDFYPRFDEFVAEAWPWIESGKLRYTEDLAIGLENAPALFEKLMAGKNIGKAVVKLS
jgi:NADPH-dependent curcumin reductase CurA